MTRPRKTQDNYAELMTEEELEEINRRMTEDSMDEEVDERGFDLGAYVLRDGEREFDDDEEVD